MWIGPRWQSLIVGRKKRENFKTWPQKFNVQYIPFLRSKNYEVTSKKSSFSRIFQTSKECPDFHKKISFHFFWVFFEKIVQFSTTRLHYKFKQYECTSKHPYPHIKGFPTISIKSVVGNASGGHFHFIWNNVQKKKRCNLLKKSSIWN